MLTYGPGCRALHRNKRPALFAHMPQIASLLRDRSGAAGVSCAAWTLFLVSNVSTALYAAVMLDEWLMAAFFAANSICSAVIVILVLVRMVKSWCGNRHVCCIRTL